MKVLNTKNFWLKGVSAIAVLLICVLILPITAKADTPGTVNDNNVNIRADADATSTSLGKVNSGDKVTIIEEKTNSSNVLWYKITTATGTTGYIRADFITKSSTDNNTTTTTNNDTTTNTTTTPTTQQNVTNIDSKAAYIAGDVVNIRSQASSTSDLVAKAQKNAEVTVTGETTASDGYKWYKVSFTADGATKTGFIRSDLLTFTKPTNPPAETNIDSNQETQTPDTNTETPDTTETVPEEGNTELAEPVEVPEETTPAEPKKMITPLQPAEDPENLPEGFEEKKLEGGEKVWTKGDYYIVYGLNEKNITGWYVLDEKNDTYIAYDGFFTGEAKKSNSDMKVFGISIKVILVILIVLIIILLGVVFFMALKLSRGVENDDDYDYDDYEDEEEEEDEIPVSSIENSRSRRSSESRSSRSVEREPKQSKASKAKDKFLNYFTTEVDDDADDDEYYDDVDEDDDDIDFIDI